MNKNKIILITATVSIIALMTTMALIIKFLDREKPQPEAPGSIEDSLPTYTPAEGQWAEVTVPPNSVGNANGIILPEVVAKDIESKARTMIQEFRFEDAENYIVDAIGPYNLDNSPAYNEIIKPFRMDLPGMSQFDYLTEYSLEDVIVEILENTHDPVNFVVSVLWQDADLREQIIISPSSLNPSYGRFDQVGPARKIIRDIEGFTDIAGVYEVPLKLDGYELKATIIDDYGWLYLYSIDEMEGVESPYITIDEWKQIQQEYFPENEEIEAHEESEMSEEVGEGDLDGENQ